MFSCRRSLFLPAVANLCVHPLESIDKSNVVALIDHGEYRGPEHDSPSVFLTLDRLDIEVVMLQS